LIVLYAIKERKIIYLLLAILIHAVIDFPAALHQAGVIKSIAIIEEFSIIVAVIALAFIVKSKKLFSDKKINSNLID
jgi:uncharacterized membrane protein YhfC